MNYNKGFINLALFSLIGLVALTIYSFTRPVPLPENEIRNLIDSYVEKSIKDSQVFGADTILPIAGTTYNLSGSGVSSSATSVTLATLTLPQTSQKLQDADFSSTFYLTLEPGNRTRQEIVSCTTVVQNTTTATLSGCVRGLSPISPYTASTTLQFAHGGGTQVIFSDPPQLFNQFTAKDNDETVSGIWDFSSTSVPRYDLVPANHNSGAIVSTTSEFASVKFVQQVSASGCVDATEGVQGCTQLATQLQMASSSENGSEAKLVLQSRYATSTPSSSLTGLYVPVSQNNGKLHQLWLDLTQAFTWTGAHIFNTSTSTFNATTSIAASTTTAPLLLNTLSYSFPSVRAASSTVLMESGTGVLTFMPISTKLGTSTTDNLNFGQSSTATSTLFTVTVPAGTLGTQNAINVRLYISNFVIVSGSSIRLALNYGGVSVAYASLSSTSDGNIEVGYIDATLFASGATNTQEGSLLFSTRIANSLATAAQTSQIYGTGSGTIDSTVAQTLSVTASYGTSNASNQMIINNGYAYVMR